MDDSILDLKNGLDKESVLLLIGLFAADTETLFIQSTTGYIPDIVVGDGEERDAYILGVMGPVSSFEENVIAVIRRKDDVEDKLVIVPDGFSVDKKQIAEAVYFQERFFESVIEM